MKDSDITYFTRSLRSIIQNIDTWKEDYHYMKKKNEFIHKDLAGKPSFNANEWFKL